MSFDAEQFVRYQISNAQLREYPFPHFYVRPVFPEDFYQEMLRHLPRTEILTPINEAGTVTTSSFIPRYIADAAVLEEDEARRGEGTFWRDISEWMGGDAFRQLIMDKFAAGVRDRFGDSVRLGTDIDLRYVRDFTNYSIEPHTDTPAKLVSLLFYLPRDASMQHLGTSIFVPIDPEFRCAGTVWHSFEKFRKVATMEYLPNSLLAFFKTDHSFHGVEVIDDANIERNVLLYNIYVKKVVKLMSAQAPRRRWPWQRAAKSA